VTVATRPRKRRGTGRGPTFPARPRTGGGGGGWVELVRARDDIDAHLLAGRLDAMGIETRKVPDRTAPGAWLYGGSNPWAPVALLVRSYQYEIARAALAELAGEEVSREDSAGAPGARASAIWWSTAVALGVVVTVIVLADLARTLGR
jgi:hypothetical protein